MTNAAWAGKTSKTRAKNRDSTWVPHSRGLHLFGANCNTAPSGCMAIPIRDVDNLGTARIAGRIGWTPLRGSSFGSAGVGIHLAKFL